MRKIIENHHSDTITLGELLEKSPFERMVDLVNPLGRLQLRGYLEPIGDTNRWPHLTSKYRIHLEAGEKLGSIHFYDEIAIHGYADDFDDKVVDLSLKDGLCLQDAMDAALAEFTERIVQEDVPCGA